MTHIRPGLLLAAACTLMACTQPSAPAPQAARPAPVYDIVAAIRKAGTRGDSAVEVAPLRDPAVEGLLDAAHAAERSGDYPAAAQATDKALKLAPRSPDILQYRAELAVRLKDYDVAERLARRSYMLGPKVGGLCARNQQTLLEMRKLAGDAVGAETARKAREKCRVEGPVRM